MAASSDQLLTAEIISTLTKGSDMNEHPQINDTRRRRQVFIDAPSAQARKSKRLPGQARLERRCIVGFRRLALTHRQDFDRYKTACWKWAERAYRTEGQALDNATRQVWLDLVPKWMANGWNNPARYYSRACRKGQHTHTQQRRDESQPARARALELHALGLSCRKIEAKLKAEGLRPASKSNVNYWIREAEGNNPRPEQFSYLLSCVHFGLRTTRVDKEVQSSASDNRSGHTTTREPISHPATAEVDTPPTWPLMRDSGFEVWDSELVEPRRPTTEVDTKNPPPETPKTEAADHAEIESPRRRPTRRASRQAPTPTAAQARGAKARPHRQGRDQEAEQLTLFATSPGNGYGCEL